MNYLRIYLRIYQIPAFAPYAWFCCSHYGPFQCTFIALLYLELFPNSGGSSRVRYIVDQAIQHFLAHYQPSPTSKSPEESETNERVPLAIQILVEFHNRLSSPHEPQGQFLSLSDTFEDLHPFSTPRVATKTSSITNCTGPPNSTCGVENNSNGNINSLTTISDLEALSSSVILESNDILIDFK